MQPSLMCVTTQLFRVQRFSNQPESLQQLNNKQDVMVDIENTGREANWGPGHISNGAQVLLDHFNAQVAAPKSLSCGL